MHTAEKAEYFSRGPGFFDWLLYAIAVLLLATGLYALFPLPLLAAVWGGYRLRNAIAPAKKQWVVYVIIGVVLAIVMALMFLLLTPVGVEQTSIGSTSWEPAR
ncbi:hypothetical protein [Corynebacterium aquilae]|uniref:Uncharacterized protein n=1 Tax=Corynebacterium aquilae DSM 44791 TaxID=1431546 RepID=A0A1L7CD58_9CORY|nr:hypothetical protein [Corynebacterium aquilae]APT83779.1 hypothetical protein CAQU_00260 [Corynebacterium aquilae DSM 44791]